MLEDRQECLSLPISVRENRAGRRLRSWLCFAYEGRGVEVKQVYFTKRSQQVFYNQQILFGRV